MKHEELRRLIDTMPVVSMHSHHLREQDQANMNLTKLLENSYCSKRWFGLDVPKDSAEAGDYLRKVGTRNLFVSLERALMKLYGIDEKLTPWTWDMYDAAVREAYKDPDWHIKVLKDICGYEKIAVDTYWEPGDTGSFSDPRFGGIFAPAYRINYFQYGYDKFAVDYKGINAQILLGTRISDIDEYLDLIRTMIKKKKADGCSIIKSALAYNRTIGIQEVSKERAAKVLCYEGTKGTPEDIAAFQDYIFDEICDMAPEEGMAVQIHTGLGLMHDSNAMQLRPLIERHRGTQFVLMHGSYPWTDDYLGLAFTYPNVFADICWITSISQTAARRLLHELIEVLNADRIAWGCDTWLSEESYGALLMFRDILFDVLTEKADSGYMTEKQAMQYARGILHDNGAGVLV